MNNLSKWDLLGFFLILGITINAIILWLFAAAIIGALAQFILSRMGLWV